MNKLLRRMEAAGLTLTIKNDFLCVGKDGHWQEGIALTKLKTIADLEDYVLEYYDA